MKFQAGDKTDTEHCIALTHEFLRCQDSFNEFRFFATAMITKGQGKWISYKCYNAYASFLHHLYEFYCGLIARERKDSKISKDNNKKIKTIESNITFSINRILRQRRDSIIRGTAPSHENDLSYYPEKAPQEFASQFRIFRNKTAGHVSYERVKKLKLTDFYGEYHKFLVMLYEDSISWWGNKTHEFPDLKEITAFSVMVIKEKNARP